MTPNELFDVLVRFAAKDNLELSSDREYVLEILEGLLTNEARYGYRSCPCRLATGDKDQDKDIICPCDYRDPDINEFGSCYCTLYVTPKWNRGEMLARIVPERRAGE